jgi:hypothetical protein
MWGYLALQHGFKYGHRKAPLFHPNPFPLYSTLRFLLLLFPLTFSNPVFVFMYTLVILRIHFALTIFAAKRRLHFRITTLTALFSIAFLVFPRCKRQKRRYREGNDAFPLCNAQKQPYSLISHRVSHVTRNEQPGYRPMNGSWIRPVALRPRLSTGLPLYSLSEVYIRSPHYV